MSREITIHMLAAGLLAALAIGCGQAPATQAKPDPRAQPVEAKAATATRTATPAKPEAAKLEIEPEAAQPLARWDTAYERPEAIEAAITQTVRAWTGRGLPLPAECLADLTDARIEVWADGADICWQGQDRGCYFRAGPSKRPVIQIQRDEPIAATLPHEVLHLLESCAGLWEDNHDGPGFRAESHAEWLTGQALGIGAASVADVLDLGGSP